MSEDSKLDLGTIQIHKKVLADITISALKDIKGVRLVTEDFKSNVFELFGYKTFPGISVTVERGNDVSIEVKVMVRYGLNIPEIARQIQDTIKTAVKKTVDVNLKDVNVNIQGIERGE